MTIITINISIQSYWNTVIFIFCCDQLPDNKCINFKEFWRIIYWTLNVLFVIVNHIKIKCIEFRIIFDLFLSV
jgi:hypothetical protein